MRVEQPKDKHIVSLYGDAAFLRRDTYDKRWSTGNKSTYRTMWPPEKIRWIQDNCLGLPHSEAVQMIVEKYDVSRKAAGAIIRRAREEE